MSERVSARALCRDLAPRSFVGKDDLAPVERLLHSRKRVERQLGAELLWTLTPLHEAARVHVRALAVAKGVQVQHALLAGLPGPEPPMELPMELLVFVLERALLSPSADVRELAARRIDHKSVYQLADCLRAAREREADPEVGAAMALRLELLTRGFIVSDAGADVVCIETTKDGELRASMVAASELAGMEVLAYVRKRFATNQRLRDLHGDGDPPAG